MHLGHGSNVENVQSKSTRCGTDHFFGPRGPEVKVHNTRFYCMVASHGADVMVAGLYENKLIKKSKKREREGIT